MAKEVIFLCFFTFSISLATPLTEDDIVSIGKVIVGDMKEVYTFTEREIYSHDFNESSKITYSNFVKLEIDSYKWSNAGGVHSNPRNISLIFRLPKVHIAYKTIKESRLRPHNFIQYLSVVTSSLDFDIENLVFAVDISADITGGACRGNVLDLQIWNKQLGGITNIKVSENLVSSTNDSDLLTSTEALIDKIINAVEKGLKDMAKSYRYRRFIC